VLDIFTSLTATPAPPGNIVPIVPEHIGHVVPTLYHRFGRFGIAEAIENRARSYEALPAVFSSKKWPVLTRLISIITGRF